MNRRKLITHVIAAAAAVPMIARADPVKSREPAPAKPLARRAPPFKLGVAGYSLRNFSLDSAIAALQSLGVAHLSLYKTLLSWEDSPSNWRLGAQKLYDAGVHAIDCGVIALKNDDISMRSAFEYARTCGCATLTCWPKIDALPLLEAMVKEYDLPVAIHNHGPGDPQFPSPREAWNVIRRLDSRIGLCVDVGHTYRAGMDPADAIRRYRERVFGVHLKDSLAEVGAPDQAIELGRGRIDQHAIVEALLDIGYTGFVGVEYEKDGDDPTSGLAESLGYVRGLLAPTIR